MSLTDDFKSRFPEFPTATVDTYVPVLETVYPSYYNKTYQSSTQEAILNLIAHLLVLETQAAAGNSGATGPIQSKSVGGVSVSYALPSSSASGHLYNVFGSTKYGQRFMLLIRNSYGGVAV